MKLTELHWKMQRHQLFWNLMKKRKELSIYSATREQILFRGNQIAEDDVELFRLLNTEETVRWNLPNAIPQLTPGSGNGHRWTVKLLGGRMVRDFTRQGSDCRCLTHRSILALLKVTYPKLDTTHITTSEKCMPKLFNLNLTHAL